MPKVTVKTNENQQYLNNWLLEVSLVVIFDIISKEYEIIDSYMFVLNISSN